LEGGGVAHLLLQHVLVVAILAYLAAGNLVLQGFDILLLVDELFVVRVLLLH
jgi:hypothetical protein